MQRKNRLSAGDRRITIAALLLLVYGSLMIASAEMGNMAGDTAYLYGVIARQLFYVVVGICAYFFLINVRVQRLANFIYWIAYFGVAFLLILCRAFGQINGAYAWITLPGGATLQPSEFAKVFMMVFATKLMGKDKGELNKAGFTLFAETSLALFVIILLIQHDLGSAVVLLVICFCVAMVPPYKELKKPQMWMRITVLAVIAAIVVVMSPAATELMRKHADNYMIGRFLAAADPFMYQYDNGYHIIMSLVSFANGGWFGLGYGNSIHKYMNFPNPSNDFILPVIVEELGIVGFAVLLILYGIMLYPLVAGSFNAKYTSSKMILLGTFIYFIVHFILNVGGVGGFLPLTGVPLLLISSGGSSMVAAMCALGLAQNELRRNSLVRHENNSGEIQEDADQNA